MTDPRGRKKGQFVGQGAVQVFFDSFGDGYIAKLYSEIHSANLIAELMLEKYNFYCGSNTVRNYLMRRREWNPFKHGGDHRSKKVLKEKKEWLDLKLKEKQ